MNSYSIDASVYAFPFSNITGDEKDAKEIKKYCNTINNLYNSITKNGKLQQRNFKYFFFYKDIELINKKNLFFKFSDVNKIQEILKNNNIYDINVKQTQKRFVELREELRINNTIKISNNPQDKFKERRQNNVIFEKWFKIENINFEPNKEPSLPVDVSGKICNQVLINNAKKNITKIAYLNKYVYKNNVNIHKIILNNGSEALINAEFKIVMFSESFINKKNINQTKNYIIKKAPSRNVRIEKQKVKISILDALVNVNYQYNSYEWEKALNDAKMKFKNYLVFGKEVESGLLQYFSKIIDEYFIMLYDPKSSRQLKELDEWMKEGPNTLFKYLKAIYNFVSAYNLSKLHIKRNERYYCSYKCEFYEECGSNLRFFGVECSNESPKIKNDSSVIKDREKMNSVNVKEIYWIHLKPKTVICDNKHLWFVTLRIHLRYLGNGKIEIGWIGRHLYPQCPKRNNISDCHRERCPFYQTYFLNKPYNPAKELTNYLKQWPKQEPEPENEPPKTEKSKKSSNILPENP
jgi:hypothetical protein